MAQRTRIARSWPGLAAIAAALTVASPGLAATKKSTSSATKEAFFRCKDASGQTYYGQSIPAECMDADIEVIDHSGRVVRVIEGRKSLQDHQQRDAEADASKKAAEAAAQRDRTLMATYLTVADIERLRDQRLGQLQAPGARHIAVHRQPEGTRVTPDRGRFESTSPMRGRRTRNPCRTTWPRKWSTR
jgi:hypothetical protein